MSMYVCSWVRTSSWAGSLLLALALALALDSWMAGWLSGWLTSWPAMLRMDGWPGSEARFIRSTKQSKAEERRFTTKNDDEPNDRTEASEIQNNPDGKKPRLRRPETPPRVYFESPKTEVRPGRPVNPIGAL